MGSCSSKLLDDEEEVSIMDLSLVIMCSIVSRLPIKDIFRCKSVCKLWYTIPSDPLFVSLYHSRSLHFTCLLISQDFRTSYHAPSVLELNQDYDYTCSGNKPIMLSPKFHLPPLNSETLEVIGSCNGFVCLKNGDLYDKNSPLYICNPLLGEYFKLESPKIGRNADDVVYGFGYSEVSGQYKVVRSVSMTLRSFDISELKVYTLGVDEKWRNLDSVPYPSLGFNVNVNGALSWMVCDDSDNCAKVYSFDIVTEKVHNFAIPPGLRREYLHLTLGELRNCLCLTGVHTTKRIDIWLMKEYGVAEYWTKLCILMDCFSRGIHYATLLPKVIWKHEEVLMHCRSNARGHLVSYNPTENKFNFINVDNNGAVPYLVRRYRPSFYSLKTIIGDNFQVSNVYPKTDIV